MIIASNSDKLTPGIQDQLLEQAKSHNPLYLDLLPTIERREAEESQAGIASSETLEDVMKPYNMLLYHERNSIAKKIGVPEEAMDDQSIEPLDNEEINLRKKYMAEILEDCYGFLGEFDPEFVERLRQFDEQKSLEGIEHLTHKNLF
ncbi:hypothetical protein ISS07_06075 [Candidatus Woesearchaeota archaeon]|nr:hypothetical protein [Candidatus Woesearchaeota archaeon]